MRRTFFILIILLISRGYAFCGEEVRNGQIDGCLMIYTSGTNTAYGNIEDIIYGIPDTATFNQIKDTTWGDYKNSVPVVMKNNQGSAQSLYFIVGQKGEMTGTPFKTKSVGKWPVPAQMNIFGWRGYARVANPPAGFTGVKMRLYVWANNQNPLGVNEPIFSFYEAYDSGGASSGIWQRNFDCQVYVVPDYGGLDSDDWTNVLPEIPNGGKANTDYTGAGAMIMLDQNEAVTTDFSKSDTYRLDINLTAASINSSGSTFFEIKSSREEIDNPIPNYWDTDVIDPVFYIYSRSERIIVEKVDFVFTTP